MRIHPDLAPNANMNPTKETTQRTIDDLCQSIDKGFLSLPLYQRDLSWTLQKSVDLLNYQLSGKSPVSAISINEINDTSVAVPQVTFVDRELLAPISGLHSVVDGQQRISTNYKVYINSPDFRNIVLDLSRGKFLAIDDTTAIKTHQIPAGILLNKDGQVLTDYLKTHKSLAKFEVQDILLKVRNKFKSYYYTINKAKDLAEEEQINWFEVLNNAGSRVSAIQMRLAKLKIYGIDIYTQYAHVFVEKVKAHGYDEVFIAQTTNLSYPISALNPAYEVIMGLPHTNNYCPMAPDVRENAICSLTPSQIETCFELTLSALDKALNFIDKNNLSYPDRIDYINYLTGYFVFHEEELSPEDESYLVKWYNSTDFKNASNSKRRSIFTNLIYKIK